MGQALGGLVLVLFVSHYVLLFYSDSKLKRLTGHLDFRWYQYQKRAAWLRQNLETHTGGDLEDARKALRSRNLALACIPAILLVVAASALFGP